MFVTSTKRIRFFEFTWSHIFIKRNAEDIESYVRYVFGVIVTQWF